MPSSGMDNPVVPCHSAPANGEDNEQYLSISVVFTTPAATLRALKQAGELAYQLGARIRIVVPHVVPYPLPINRPAVDPNFKLRQFRTLFFQYVIETHIDILLCRDAHECLKKALASHSIVLIGDRNRFWLTREKRPTQALRHSGHQVIFVPQE